MAQSYIICGTPRSGSTLLCDLLTDTGVAGVPASFFRRQSIANWAGRLSISTADGTDSSSFNRAYLDAIIAKGTGATGIFGLRLMWENAPELQQRLRTLFPDAPDDPSRLAAAFGTPTHIYLSRADKVAQAISLYRALLSGLWHIGSDGSAREGTSTTAPAYDRAAIARIVDELTTHDAAWRGWFERHGIAPLAITYESLSNDPAAALASVLTTLGRDPALATHVQPRTGRLANAETTEWIARFRRGG